MTIPYRTRRFLHGLAIFFLVLILVAVLVWLVWLLWLDRYVVYTSDGAVLDFDRSDKEISGIVAMPPAEDETVSIFYNEGDEALNISTEMVQLKGYYIDAKMLEADISGVLAQLRKLPAQTPVMIELKDIAGRYFYSTSLGPARSSISTTAVDELLEFLNKSDLYAIAKVASLRDYYYGLDHVSDGLPTSGGYLWMDDDRCYWLNPASQGTVTYLIQIVSELKELGFDEVVLGDFCFPQTDSIKFSGDKTEALLNTAQSLIAACGSDRFTLSFLVTDPAFPLPEGRTRIYVEGQSAGEAKNAASQVAFTDTAVRLVFLTEVNDTRFDDYGVLRPITSFALEE